MKNKKNLVVLILGIIIIAIIAKMLVYQKEGQISEKSEEQKINKTDFTEMPDRLEEYQPA